MTKDGTATQRTFTHVPTTIEAEEAEEIGVEHLLRDVSSSSGAPSSSLLTTQSLSTRVTTQLSALRGLHARLADIGEYLDRVRAGKMPINHQVISQVQEVVGLLPQLGGDAELGKAFRVGVNDSSMVVYLSALVRTVLALHELSEFPRASTFGVCKARKLIGVVDNRISMAQQELDDAKTPEQKKAEAAAEAAGVKAEDVEKARKEKKDEDEKKAKK
jgi:26S proteasome regulatory subunit N8